jgi:hypothetical protein
MYLPRPNCSMTKSIQNLGLENGVGSLSGLGVRRTFAVEVIGPSTAKKTVSSQLQNT